MTFGEKLRRARREKGLTQAELANQAGLGLRTIIAYEKGETYPQKRSTYQTLADILGVQADDLHNEETTASAPPLSRTQWENSKRRYEELLPDGPAWTGDSSYEEYCKKWRNRPMRTPRAIPINRPDQSFRKSRSARPWRRTFRRYCKSARTATSSTLHEQALTKVMFRPLNPAWKR